MTTIVFVWQSFRKPPSEHHSGQEEKGESGVSAVKAVTETAEVTEQHGKQSSVFQKF